MERLQAPLQTAQDTQGARNWNLGQISVRILIEQQNSHRDLTEIWQRFANFKLLKLRTWYVANAEIAEQRDPDVAY